MPKKQHGQLNGLQVKLDLKFLRVFRKLKNISMEQLSNSTKISEATLYKYENGTLSPSIESLVQIAFALKLPKELVLLLPIRNYPNSSSDESTSNGLIAQAVKSMAYEVFAKEWFINVIKYQGDGKVLDFDLEGFSLEDLISDRLNDGLHQENRGRKIKTNKNCL